MLTKIALLLAALTLLSAMYLAPTLVAVGRRARFTPAIVGLNILLGWSVIGWLVALVWSVVASPESESEHPRRAFSFAAFLREHLPERLLRRHNTAGPLSA